MNTTSKLGIPTLSSLVEDFLESCANLSPKTLSSYRISLKNLEWYAQQNHWPANASDITRSHIREFLAYVGKEGNRWGYTNPSLSSAKPASRSTVHRYGRVIKTMFRWATDEEQCLEENPTQRLKLGSPQYKEIEPYRGTMRSMPCSICATMRPDTAAATAVSVIRPSSLSSWLPACA